uniref:Uncharacterized protein n=1 Tax=Rhizophora mucronata TaxID=61149 RepID=A0A2P2Q3D5_RHIMU
MQNNTVQNENIIFYRVIKSLGRKGALEMTWLVLIR